MKEASSPEGDGSAPTAGTDLMAAFLPQSPFVVKLGVQVEEMRRDWCRLRMPWQPENTTVGPMLHGGALAGLVDIAGMIAAWSGVEELPAKLRGVTTSLAVEFLAPANETDVLAEGRVLRRGRTLVQVEIDVLHPDGEALVKGLLAYKIG